MAIRVGMDQTTESPDTPSRFMMNADEFKVQASSMKALLADKVGSNTFVSVLLLMAINDAYGRTVTLIENKANKLIEFPYVSSGEPRKNHLQLIEACYLFGKKLGLFSSLKLILGKVNFEDLCFWVNLKKSSIS
jgi:hypothetical protein